MQSALQCISLPKCGKVIQHIQCSLLIPETQQCRLFAESNQSDAVKTCSSLDHVWQMTGAEESSCPSFLGKDFHAISVWSNVLKVKFDAYYWEDGVRYGMKVFFYNKIYLNIKSNQE